MAKEKLMLAVISVVLFAMLVVSIVALNYQAYLLMSFAIIAGMMLPFFIRFEFRKVTGKEIVLLAMLAAIAAVGRVPFAALPSVQPTTFVIIVVGIVFGAESGFIVGAVAALVSNIFLGQGPWTPWQMYAWGMVGMTAGFLRNTWWMRSMAGQLIFGFLWGYLFGWFMNLWIIVSNLENFTWEVFTSIYIASIYFDLAHALSNVFFLFIFSRVWVKILERFKVKYGMFT